MTRDIQYDSEFLFTKSVFQQLAVSTSVQRPHRAGNLHYTCLDTISMAMQVPGDIPRLVVHRARVSTETRPHPETSGAGNLQNGCAFGVILNSEKRKHDEGVQSRTQRENAKLGT